PAPKAAPAPEAKPAPGRSLAQRLQKTPRAAPAPEPATPPELIALTPPPLPAPIVESVPANGHAEPAPGAPAAPPTPEPARPRPAETTVRLSTTKLDALMEVVGELQAARLAADQRLAELRGLLANAESWEALSRAVRQHERRLRLAATGVSAAGLNG